MSRPQTKKFVREILSHVEPRLVGGFVKIPTTACGCGKPVVFVNGSKKFHCSRCGKWWRLIIVIKEDN